MSWWGTIDHHTPLSFGERGYDFSPFSTSLRPKIAVSALTRTIVRGTKPQSTVEYGYKAPPIKAQESVADYRWVVSSLGEFRRKSYLMSKFGNLLSKVRFFKIQFFISQKRGSSELCQDQKSIQNCWFMGAVLIQIFGAFAVGRDTEIYSSTGGAMNYD